MCRLQSLAGEHPDGTLRLAHGFFGHYLKRHSGGKLRYSPTGRYTLRKDDPPCRRRAS